MSEPLDPVATLLADLPATLRRTVEEARARGDWSAARKALVAAGRSRTGPHHATYGRLLLALDEFDACRSLLDRLDPDALPDPGDVANLRAELLLEEAAATHWSPVPGRPHQRVPTSRSAMEAVRSAIDAARALNPSSPATLAQIEAFERAVRWSGRSARDGGLVGPLGAVTIGAVFALHGVRSGGGAWLGAALSWIASAPLGVLAASRPQWERNARVVEGRQTLDDAILAWLARGPPALAPLGLAGRLVIYGLLAPFSVLQASFEGRKPLPAVVLCALSIWAFLAAPDLSLPTTPAPVVALDEAIHLGDRSWRLGEPASLEAISVGDVTATPVLLGGTLDGLVLRGPTDPRLTLKIPGRAAGPESTISPPGTPCEVTLRSYDSKSGGLSVRTTACPPRAGPRWTVELSRR